MPEHKENSEPGLGSAENTFEHLTGERPVNRVRPIPDAYRNIQVNFCKKPGCPNFCVVPLLGPSRQSRRSGSDGYRLVGARAESALRCSYCGVESRIKSNRAIHQEFRRQAAPLFAPSPLVCPNDGFHPTLGTPPRRFRGSARAPRALFDFAADHAKRRSRCRARRLASVAPEPMRRCSVTS